MADVPFSSSSDENIEDCFYEFNYGTPWAMKPLVYYTHVERHPNKRTESMSTDAPDVRGFALWLDEKYREYLRDNRQQRTSFPCESYGGRKFKRQKSPRKRHQKLTNSKDASLRSNKSFEVLLHPKHVSRTTSECCQRFMYYGGFRETSCCTNCTTNSLENKNIKRKSQSLTSILVEKEVCVIPYDTKNNEAKKEVKEEKRYGETNKIIATLVEGANKDPAPQINDMSCQCSKENISKADECCQCKINNPQIKIQPNNTSISIKNNNAIPLRAPPIPVQQSVNENENTSELKKSAECRPNCMTVQKEETKESKEKTIVKEINGTQTSDCTIHLPTTQYPLFMRIICPEKINES
ncbi:unnamed protein product [Leptosia nina]|uniref:Uncharacterized protein n=1 Tax=Leptosia nina TaxID=320188 RepID=A0AAV1JGX6_9NEOP